MRIPRPAVLFLVIVALTMTGLVVARVAAQVEDSPTEHPPIVVPSASIEPSPTPSPTPTPKSDDDDDDDGFDQVQPEPRDLDDDDDEPDR